MYVHACYFVFEACIWFQKTNVPFAEDVTMSGAYATPGTETVSLSGLGALDYPYVTYSEVTSGIPYSQTNLSPASPDAGLASAVFDTHPGYLPGDNQCDDYKYK